MIEAIRRGEKQALAQLYQLYCRKVYGLAYQMLGNHVDADEILQQTFIKVYQAIDELRDPRAFATWIYRITTRLCLDYLQNSKKKPIESIQEMGNNFELATSRWVSTPDQILENQELLAAITQAIDELPPQQKTIIILQEIEGFSKKQIAEILDCPLGTVRSNLHYAREKLRKKLTKYIESE